MTQPQQGQLWVVDPGPAALLPETLILVVGSTFTSAGKTYKPGSPTADDLLQTGLNWHGIEPTQHWLCLLKTLEEGNHELHSAINAICNSCKLRPKIPRHLKALHRLALQTIKTSFCNTINQTPNPSSFTTYLTYPPHTSNKSKTQTNPNALFCSSPSTSPSCPRPVGFLWPTYPHPPGLAS